METLSNIIEDQAGFVERSGYTVNINRAQSWVHITNGKDDEGVFMQGHEAEEFLQEVDTLADRADATTYRAATALAKPYIECLD